MSFSGIELNDDFCRRIRSSYSEITSAKIKQSGSFYGKFSMKQNGFKSNDIKSIYFKSSYFKLNYFKSIYFKLFHFKLLYFK